MSQMHERQAWSSGNSREHTGVVHKSLTAALGLNAQLFPKVRKQKETLEKDTDGTEETEESASSASLPVDENARSLMAKALESCGYSKDLLEDGRFMNAFSKAVSERAEIITKRTGRLWIEREIPEEPPAFVRPGKLKVGDHVQVLNWVPMGVQGAKIDLFPRGKVTKVYSRKCLVSKKPIPFGYIPEKDVDYEEEDRVLGVELDGKGSFPVKEGSGRPFPYITKDSTVIMRFAPLSEPSGQTDHVGPGVM